VHIGAVEVVIHGEVNILWVRRVVSISKVRRAESPAGSFSIKGIASIGTRDPSEDAV